jgi:hypothetical protein
MCRVCTDDKSCLVWCDAHWAVVKAKALVAPARVSKRTKVNAVLRPALGLESDASVVVGDVDFSTWGVLWFTFTL